ncbi:uncharacterized protein N0V89_003603 [Didymosphaeria variabile]|uniref:DNA (cytosine-5)-methyltransferase 1 replication foci domain-containing protein n=1 Tax=Didymosphaeria variabile TaxID=1932322 RepID=A0A9W9CCG7_9PLEO|nr:uncharacterized protein N0V89_003603 [Didymosphaeria variabile]KAJ4355583.1 hypothetical protein N0V89_003603 [Didymosphaeria variabile]
MAGSRRAQSRRKPSPLFSACSSPQHAIITRSKKMPVPELEVLKPANPASDSEDYFVLSNAHVVYESNGKPASLLSAYADVLLRVEGRLEPLDRSMTRCLVKKPYKPVDVVIRKVSRFSYGLQGDTVVIWAMGEAGWFELRPARHYKETFDTMAQAVELLYFLADIYSEPRKKGGGPNASLIFQEYAEDERFECNDVASAEQIFRKHHQFLMMRFLHRAEDIGWSNTPIYQYFKKQYPVCRTPIVWNLADPVQKVFESIKARKEGRYDEVPKEPSSVKPTTAPAAQPSRSVRSRSHVEKPSAPPKKDDNWWEAAAIYDFIRSAVNKRVLRPGRHQITMDRIAELMTKRYEIEEVDTARNVLLVHAQNLCYKMDHPRSKSASFLADEPIYRELETGHDLPAADIRKAQAVALRPRKDHAPLESAESDISDSETSNDVVVTPQRRADGRKKKGRLSVLRPRSSKYSGKGKTVQPRKGSTSGTRSSEEADSSAESEVAEAERDSDSVIEIDTPTQALSPSREKRKFIDTSDDVEEKGRRKRAASSSVSSEPIPSSSDSDAQAAENEVPLPLRNRSNSKPSGSQTKSNLETPIISTPLPTYEANGPRDSWTCTFDGCNQRIYGASKPIGRQLITEHLEDHAKNRQQVVGVVWRENQKLALPVKLVI